MENLDVARGFGEGGGVGGGGGGGVGRGGRRDAGVVVVRAGPFVGQRHVELLAAGGQPQVALGAVADAVGAADGVLRRQRRTVHGADAHRLALHVLTDGSVTARQVGTVAQFVTAAAAACGTARGETTAAAAGGAGAAALGHGVDQPAVLAAVALEADDVVAADAPARHLFAVVAYRTQRVAVARCRRRNHKRREQVKKTKTTTATDQNEQERVPGSAHAVAIEFLSIIPLPTHLFSKKKNIYIVPIEQQLFDYPYLSLTRQKNR